MQIPVDSREFRWIPMDSGGICGGIKSIVFGRAIDNSTNEDLPEPADNTNDFPGSFSIPSARPRACKTRRDPQASIAKFAGHKTTDARTRRPN